MLAISRFCYLSVLLAILQFGCASYRVGNETFHSPDEALARQRQIQAEDLSKISPTQNPVPGRALIVLPTLDAIESEYVVVLGNRAAASQDHLNFMKNAWNNGLHFFADSIVKRKVFSDANIITGTADQRSFPAGYDFLLYSEVGGWLIRGKNDQSTYQIVEYRKKDLPQDRVSLFLDEIEKVARNISLRTSQ